MSSIGLLTLQVSQVSRAVWNHVALISLDTWISPYLPENGLILFFTLTIPKWSRISSLTLARSGGPHIWGMLFSPTAPGFFHFLFSSNNWYTVILGIRNRLVVMSSITDHEPGQGGLTVSTTMEYCKPALSRGEVMSNEGPQREGRQHGCVQAVGLAVLHMQCTCSQHCYRLYLTEPSGEQSPARWLQWKTSLEGVMSFSGEPEGIKLFTGWWPLFQVVLLCLLL